MDDILENCFVCTSCKSSAGDSSIGKDDVKLAKVLGKFCEELITVLCDRNVGAIGARVRSEFCYRFIQRLLVAAGNGNLYAFSDEKTRCGQADATAAARNQSLLARELHHLPLKDTSVQHHHSQQCRQIENGR